MSLLKAVSLQVLKEGGEATLVVSLPFFHFWVIQGCCVQFLGYLKFDAFFLDAIYLCPVHLSLPWRRRKAQQIGQGVKDSMR